METIGALIMVLGGVGALASIPVIVLVVIIDALRQKKRSQRFYMWLGGMPVILLSISILTFVIRSAAAVFFS